MPRINFLPLLFLFFSALVSANYLNYCQTFELVPSKKKAETGFLKSDCLGVYKNTTMTQCSYLNLNQCYVLGPDTQYHPQRLGKGLDGLHAPNCRLTYADDHYKNNNKATGMECTQPGELGGTYTADFRRRYYCFLRLINTALLRTRLLSSRLGRLLLRPFTFLPAADKAAIRWLVPDEIEAFCK
ncbi:hypothetical protein PG994_002227 [Apiospora phragmitis]|uniref:Cyanovirin-N domain-containing protein n=1 Tax=Apiospora phragmitis TaxID=2905665 RepID=A0ABR1WVU7_9PEZI